MKKVEIIYKNSQTVIQFHEDDKIKNILKEFEQEKNIDINKLLFKYNEKEINIELKYSEIVDQEGKSNNLISLLAFDKNEEEFKKEEKEETDNINKSIFPKCSECGENILLEYDKNKLLLYGCKNGHNSRYLDFDEYEKIKNTKKIGIDENIYYKCNLHNEKYNYYCKTCKENICNICKNNHNNVHEIICFETIMPNIEEYKKNIEELKTTIDKFYDSLTSKINQVKQNIEYHYKINKDLIYNFDINKLNYEGIQNIQYINKSSINIIEKLNDYNQNNILKIINQIDNFYNNYITIIYKKNNDDPIKIFGNDFVKNNKELCKIKYNGIKYRLEESFKVKSDKNEIEIQLRGINNISNASCMFRNCNSLLSIPDILKWNTINVKNMSQMFENCNSIILPDLSKWNTSNVQDMNRMFSKCSELLYLPDLSTWNTENVQNMSWMFLNCSSLLKLPDISKWNTEKVKNMSWMFHNCSSLSKLPDISNWKIFNVTHMNCMFRQCSSLTTLPDLSKWMPISVQDMSLLFAECTSLKLLPDISKWDTSSVNDMSKMFSYCLSLTYLPDISKWNVSNVKNIEYMFEYCESLPYLPDLSKWNLINVSNMNHLFYGCTSLAKITNVSKWNRISASNKYGMFDQCLNNLNISSKY